MEQAALKNTTIIKSVAVTELSDSDWLLAKKRFDIIAPLLNEQQKMSVYTIAKQSGIGKSTLYRWLEKFTQTGNISSLANDENDGGKGKNRLPKEIEEIVISVIEERYLNQQRLSIQKTTLEITAKCRLEGLKPPSYKAIRQRINAINLEDKLSRRYHKSVARDILKPLEGSFPGADYPLAVVQIDHTPLDILVVDDTYREPVGKPWITVAIDVYSRMIVGFYISLETPGALGTGLCISHAIMPKEQWLSRLDIQGKWPCYGLPKTIYVDNAKEFRGQMLQRACQEYGIELNFRPVKTPNYGGHIERLLGTVLKEIHTLPGTTFSNTKERRHYDSAGKACFTINEFEQWLGTFIVNVYHKKLHSSIKTTPYAKYEEGILGNDKQPGTGLGFRVENEAKLKLDFMPFVERSVQRYGIVIDFIYYYSDVLRKWVHSYENPDVKNKVLRKFIFKRDPRDISVVYFFDPALKEYFEIPYRNTGHPSITIWEHRNILREMKNRGLAEINEEMIFDAYAQMKNIEDNAVTTTATAKRNRNKARKQYAAVNSVKNHLSVQQQKERVSTDTIDFTKKYLPFEDIEG